MFLKHKKVRYISILKLSKTPIVFRRKNGLKILVFWSGNRKIE